MAQKAALEVIRYIEDFWGQPLTRRLADRIADRDLSDEVFDFYANWPPLRELPDLTDDIPRLEPGQVRPVVGSIIHPYTEMATAPFYFSMWRAFLWTTHALRPGGAFIEKISAATSDGWPT
ncbi:hypothetical protein [Leifsonia xyli]|uniref:hypothetical protein n=1 Tax=Leifsonia xyli TaxID=1575 RepID=UPI003D674898